MNRPRIFAHRGASLIAPENTLAALTAAAKAGANWVEVDVQLTRDHEVVVFHDKTLDRTTDYVGCLSSFTAAELQNCDAGQWFDTKFKAERIPSLVQCLDCLMANRLAVNIETKGRYQGNLLVEKTWDLVQPYLNKIVQPILFSSSSLLHLRRLFSIDAQCEYGAIMHYWPFYFPAVIRHARCVSIHINYHCLNANRIKRLKKMDKKIYAYTVNDVDLAKQLFVMGVDGVFTDDMTLLSLRQSGG